MTASELSYAYPNKMALFRGMNRGKIEVVLGMAVGGALAVCSLIQICSDFPVLDTL